MMNCAKPPMNKFLKLAFILVLGALPAPAAGAPEDDVLETVTRFFEGLKTTDAETWRDVLHENARFFAHRQQEDGTWLLSEYEGQERIESLADETVLLDERMYEPTVLVRGPIAVVWAPYDITVNGEHSHCGIDVFDLVQVESAWKITNLTYTTELDACGELDIPARTIPEN